MLLLHKLNASSLLTCLDGRAVIFVGAQVSDEERRSDQSGRHGEAVLEAHDLSAAGRKGG